MLYAGTTSIFSFKYFILNDIVKKLELRSISAGKHLKSGTSETLRNEAVVNKENIKLISVNVAKHLKPVSIVVFK